MNAISLYQRETVYKYEDYTVHRRVFWNEALITH